jgi:hypothetical protein
VLWIRDILVRIRIRGSIPLVSDPDPAFLSAADKMPTKKYGFF